MFCFGGPRVNLSPLRQKLMQLLRFGIFCEFVFSIVAICGGRYIDGALYVVFSLFYIYPLRSSKQVGTDIMCLLSIHTFQAIFAIIYLILHLCKVRVYPTPSQLWRRRCLEASIYGLVVIFVLVSILCFFIFREVRRKLYGGEGSSTPAGQGYANPNFQHDDVESQPQKKDKKKNDDWKKSGGHTLGTSPNGGKTTGGSNKNTPNPWTQK